MLHDIKGRFKPGDVVYLRCEVVGYDSTFSLLGTVALRAVSKDRKPTEHPTVWLYARDSHLVDYRAIEDELKENGYDAGWKDCLEAIRNGTIFPPTQGG